MKFDTSALLFVADLFF